MVNARTHNTSGQTFHKRGHERERPLKSRGRVKNRRVGHNTDEAVKNKHGESEGLRPGGQTGNPCCIFGVVWGGVLNMRVYQYVHIGEQHPGSASSKPETDFIIMRVKCSRPVKVNSNASLDIPHSHQMERLLLRNLTALQCVTQRLSYESTDTHAAGSDSAADLSSELFTKRYHSSHNAQHNMLSPLISNTDGKNIMKTLCVRITSAKTSPQATDKRQMTLRTVYPPPDVSLKRKLRK